MYNFKPIDILIFITIVSIIILFLNSNAEHLTTLSNESVQNVSSVYNKDLMTVTNLNVIGAFNMIPTGAIIMWNGTVVPVGWLLCDGTSGTPDLRGRFVLGAGSGTSLTKRILADKGGAETHTLGVTEIPSHYHQLHMIKWSSKIDAGQPIYDEKGNLTTTQKKYGRNKTGSGKNDDDNDYQTLSAGTSGSIGVPGSSPTTVGKSHNNMPPYYVLTYIMKA